MEGVSLGLGTRHDPPCCVPTWDGAPVAVSVTLKLSPPRDTQKTHTP